VTVPSGVRRTGPPQAVQKVREDSYIIHVPLSEAPSADWRRLFYEVQQNPPESFPPRSVEFTGTGMRFRSGAESVEEKIAWLDRWISRANEKDAAMGGRSEEQRRKREEWSREQNELAELNSRWTKLAP
jgi:hypothetical protein